jgi:hypothetical protein
MRSITVTVTGAGSSAPIPMNLDTSPFNVGFGVIPSSANYTVQHSFDNPLVEGYSAAAATWFNHPTIASQTTNQDGNYAFPVAAIRLTVNSGTSATMTLIQAGIA